jgi:Spy/CpxP family protein refolding chaperone
MGGFEDARVAKQWALVAESQQNARSERAKAHEALDAALAKASADPAAAQAALEKLRSLDSERQVQNTKLVVALVPLLTAEERQQFASLQGGPGARAPQGKGSDAAGPKAPKAPAASPAPQ